MLGLRLGLAKDGHRKRDRTLDGSKLILVGKWKLTKEEALNNG
jgi:hypothetical protein